MENYKKNSIKVGQEYKGLKHKNREIKVLKVDEDYKSCLGYAYVDITHIGKCIIRTDISIEELISDYKLK
tara:strand:- start:428 stop:637 length:210 start_codon:yes stop_codon:yes gene_type:complete